MFDPTELAKRAVKTYIATGRMPAASDDIPAEWRRPGAVFVSIKKGGQLRGCVGTYAPTRPTLADEIMHNAVSSALDDPRFSAVTADELEELEFSVDVLEPPHRVKTADDLDAKVYGVIVQSGAKLGLLLPDLEGVDTVEQQVAIARQKAGIRPQESLELFRFKVKRFKDQGSPAAPPGDK